MEEIKSNPILKFNKDHLKNVRTLFGYEDVNKLRQDVEQLDHWIRKQNHFRVKDYDRDYLERFLICNKGSIEKAKRKFDKFCTCINLMPEFLQNFDIRNEFHPIFNVVNMCILPKPTKENHRIFVSNVTGFDHNDFNSVLFFRYVIVQVYYMLNNDYCQGYELIIDSRKLTFNVFSKINPIVLHKCSALIFGTMSQGVKKAHLISGSKFFDAFVLFFKHALGPKFKNRIVIHSSVENIHQYIPREQLPEDFGGDEKSIKDLTEIMFKELCTDSHINMVKLLEKASTDESLRQLFQFNEMYSGMPGTFKTLCVD